MTESQFTSKLLRALRVHPVLRDAVIWKTADRFTRGIPDVLVSLNGVTTFFELKCWPNRVTKIQNYYLKKLAPRGHVVTFGRDSLIYMNEVQIRFDLRGYEFNAAIFEIVRRCIDA